MGEAVQSAGVIMEKTNDKEKVVLPVTELIQLWYENVRANMVFTPALVGSAIVGTAKVVRG